MPEPGFPLYRRSTNNMNWYRIESATAFTEVQQVGSRFVAHHVQAVIWPDRARIMELIAMADGHVAACDAAEFGERLALAAPHG